MSAIKVLRQHLDEMVSRIGSKRGSIAFAVASIASVVVFGAVVNNFAGTIGFAVWCAFVNVTVAVTGEISGGTISVTITRIIGFTVVAIGIGAIAVAITFGNYIQNLSPLERERLRATVIKNSSKLLPFPNQEALIIQRQKRKLNPLPSWVAHRLSEEYQRHLIDFREQWFKESNSRWIVQCKTLGYLLATVWAGNVSKLQSLASFIRII